MAFLLTDIEGSTRLWQAQPGLMRQVIQRHDALVRDGIRARGGKVLNDHGEGDSFFAVFPRVSETLAAARDIQRAISQESWPPDAAIRVRIAINVGEAVGDYRGMAANRCGRIRQLARGGQVLVSQSTATMVRDELPAGISLIDLGPHRLRDVAFPEHLFEARIEGTPESAPTQPRNARARIAELISNRRHRALIAAPLIAALLAVALIISQLLHPPATPTRASDGTSSPKAVSLTNMTITTVAGNGTPGYDARGLVRATDAELNHPSGIAVDANGDVFIADTLNGLVRELRPDGTLSTVVGGGKQFAASGQIGTEIVLKRPTALQVDNKGNLCVADTGDNKVLKVDPADQVTLIAGSGGKGSPAAGDDASLTKFDAPTGVDCVSSLQCDVFSQCVAGIVVTSAAIIDSGTHRVWTVGSGTVDDFVIGGLGSNQDMPPLAPGGAPDLVQTNPNEGPDTSDGGDVYVSDSGANKILKITTAGNVLQFAGTGVAGYTGNNGAMNEAELNMPEGLALDSSQRLYIADTGNNVIRVVDLRSGKIVTIAGNDSAGFLGDSGLATQAELFGPTAVAVAPNGRIYIADTNNNRVRMLSPG